MLIGCTVNFIVYLHEDAWQRVFGPFCYACLVVFWCFRVYVYSFYIILFVWYVYLLFLLIATLCLFPCVSLRQRVFGPFLTWSVYFCLSIVLFLSWFTCYCAYVCSATSNNDQTMIVIIMMHNNDTNNMWRGDDSSVLGRGPAGGAVESYYCYCYYYYYYYYCYYYYYYYCYYYYYYYYYYSGPGLGPRWRRRGACGARRTRRWRPFLLVVLYVLFRFSFVNFVFGKENTLLSLLLLLWLLVVSLLLLLLSSSSSSSSFLLLSLLSLLLWCLFVVVRSCCLFNFRSWCFAWFVVYSLLMLLSFVNFVACFKQPIANISICRLMFLFLNLIFAVGRLGRSERARTRAGLPESGASLRGHAEAHESTRGHEITCLLIVARSLAPIQWVALSVRATRASCKIVVQEMSAPGCANLITIGGSEATQATGKEWKGYVQKRYSTRGYTRSV